MMLENDKRKIKNPSSFIHEKSAPAFCYLKKNPQLLYQALIKSHTEVWKMNFLFQKERKKGYSDDI